MEDRYNDIRNYLRNQHNANSVEVHSRYQGRSYAYHYDDVATTDNFAKKPPKHPVSGFVFWGKIAVFILSVLTFSCYIYGGQDLKKGFRMAVSDTNDQIVKLEQDNETVRETMTQVRNVWHNVRDFAGEYFKEYNTN
ncbi:MAG: hypothetical protein K6G76_12310 [Lachnospiraceae bacterium]|nr:hypothetical protein [Lachnospiraceae bacterium]